MMAENAATEVANVVDRSPTELGAAMELKPASATDIAGEKVTMRQRGYLGEGVTSRPWTYICN